MGSAVIVPDGGPYAMWVNSHGQQHDEFGTSDTPNFQIKVLRNGLTYIDLAPVQFYSGTDLLGEYPPTAFYDGSSYLETSIVETSQVWQSGDELTLGLYGPGGDPSLNTSDNWEDAGPLGTTYTDPGTGEDRDIDSSGNWDVTLAGLGSSNNVTVWFVQATAVLALPRFRYPNAWRDVNQAGAPPARDPFGVAP